MARQQWNTNAAGWRDSTLDNKADGERHREGIDDEAGGTSPSLSVQEAGAKGGRRTLELRGPDFFREIGRRGGASTAKSYAGLFKEFGRKGGRPRRPAFGEDGFIRGKKSDNEKEAMRSAPILLPPPDYSI